MSHLHLTFHFLKQNRHLISKNNATWGRLCDEGCGFDILFKDAGVPIKWIEDDYESWPINHCSLQRLMAWFYCQIK